MAINNVYDIGDRVRVTVTFQVSSVNTDPSTITFYYINGSGSETAHVYGAGQVIKSATGIYYIDLDITESPGTWHYQWRGTGTCVAVDEGEFFVRPTRAL